MKEIIAQLFLILGLIIPSFGQQSSSLLHSYQQYQQAKNNTLFHTQWKPVGPVLNSARVESSLTPPARKKGFLSN